MSEGDKFYTATKEPRSEYNNKPLAEKPMLADKVTEDEKREIVEALRKAAERFKQAAGGWTRTD
jgi:hypothetical protein